MVWNFILQFLVAFAFNVVAYLIAPKPKQEKPAASRDLENPTAEVGRPIPVPFGDITIKGLNVLWFGEKSLHQYDRKV